MKATLNSKRTELKKRMTRISDSTPKRSARKILQLCRVSINGHCKVTSTNMDLYSEIQIADSFSGNAEFLVDPRALAKLLPKKGNDCKLEVSDRTISIGAQRFNLAVESPDKFPTYPTGYSPKIKIQVSAVDLIRMISQTLYATDCESVRYALGGVLLDVDGKTLSAVATDGRRLATSDTRIECDESMTAIIPLRSCKVILKALKHWKNETVEIRFNERCSDEAGSVEFIIGDDIAKYFTRCVEGRFPKWRDVIPSTHDTDKHCQFEPSDFQSLVDGALAVADLGASRGVDFSFNGGKIFGSYHLDAKDEVTATDWQAEIDATLTGGDSFETCLDMVYLAEFLKVASGLVSLYSVSPDHAHLFISDCGMRYVLMPLSKDRRNRTR